MTSGSKTNRFLARDEAEIRQIIERFTEAGTVLVEFADTSHEATLAWAFT